MTNAAAAGSFAIAGDLEVNRLAFGAMRITGRGMRSPPARPPTPTRPGACCAAPSSWTST